MRRSKSYKRKFSKWNANSQTNEITEINLKEFCQEDLIKEEAIKRREESNLLNTVHKRALIKVRPLAKEKKMIFR
jgi:hypothetical protein